MYAIVKIDVSHVTANKAFQSNDELICAQTTHYIQMYYISGKAYYYILYTT